MTARYIARFETYDADRIDSLCEDPAVMGVVLGDLFCRKRMYPRGLVDEVLFMKKILDLGMLLVYQAPMYVTGRNLEESRSVLSLMNDYPGKCLAVVQDFGTAELIRREYGNIRLIWGQLGRVREHRFSDEFLRFLRERQFYGFETSDLRLAERLVSSGLVPVIGNAVIQYQTLGRECYLRYETGICDPKTCCEGRCSLRTEDGTMQMTIDGYMLGKKLRYLSQETFAELCREFCGIPVVYESLREE